MSKLTEAYIRSIKPNSKIKHTSFRYGDLGNCYSYVEFNAEVDGKDFSKQLKVQDFFEWIGESILNITSEKSKTTK